MTTPDKFWERVERKGPDDCWLWKGANNGRGYGRLRFRGKYYAAHRLAFELSSGKAPQLCVLHSCDNPPCCNPKHLREGTNEENSLDMIRRGRSRRGKNFFWSEELRQAVRDAHFIDGMSLMDIAVLGIPYGTVSNILYQPKRRYLWNGGRSHASHVLQQEVDPTVNAAAVSGENPEKTAQIPQM